MKTILFLSFLVFGTNAFAGTGDIGSGTPGVPCASVLGTYRCLHQKQSMILTLTASTAKTLRISLDEDFIEVRLDGQVYLGTAPNEHWGSRLAVCDAQKIVVKNYFKKDFVEAKTPAESVMTFSPVPNGIHYQILKKGRLDQLICLK